VGLAGGDRRMRSERRRRRLAGAGAGSRCGRQRYPTDQGRVASQPHHAGVAGVDRQISGRRSCDRWRFDSGPGRPHRADGSCPGSISERRYRHPCRGSTDHHLSGGWRRVGRRLQRAFGGNAVRDRGTPRFYLAAPPVRRLHRCGCSPSSSLRLPPMS